MLEHGYVLANPPPPQNATLTVLKLSAHETPLEEHILNVHQIFACSLKRISGLHVSSSSTSPGAGASTERDPGS